MAGEDLSATLGVEVLEEATSVFLRRILLTVLYSSSEPWSGDLLGLGFGGFGEEFPGNTG